MPLFIYQVKQAFINLSRKPGFVFSVISTMGITLGALLCVLTLAYVMLIKPLPYPEQEQLFQIEQQQIDSEGQHNVSGFNYPGLIDYYHKQDIFSEQALVDYDVSSLVSHPDSPVVQFSYVTPQWFELFATPLAKGRYFSAEEGLESYTPVAVISYQAWQRLFNGKEDILGTKVSNRNHTYTIVGVTAEHFVEPELVENGYQTELWFPWDFNPTPERNREIWWGRAHQRTIIGKLKPEYSIDVAQEKASQYINQQWQLNNADSSYFKGWHVNAKLHSLNELIIGESRFATTMLVLGSLCLLLIASINILNLFVSNLATNRQALSIHASIGAKPSHLFNGLLIETTMLIFSSLIIALGLADVGFSLLQHYLISALPRINELQLQSFTVYAAIVFGSLLTYIFALTGKNSLNFRALGTNLVSGGKGQKAQITKTFRRNLMVSQVAISSILIFIGVNLLFKSIDHITFDNGLADENLLSLQVRMQAENLPSREARDVLLDQLRENLIALPEINDVSRSSSPLTGELGTWSLTELNSMKQVLPYGKNIDERYFEMSGQTLVQGERFSQQQVKDKTRDIIINETLAYMLDPDGNALGMRLSFGTSKEDKLAFTIKGIVTGLKMPGADNIPPRVYKPMNNSFNMMIELNEHQTLSKETLLKVMAESSSIFKIFKFEHLTTLKQAKLYSFYITLTVTAVITVLSIILTIIGLYGMLNYATQMRRFEIGTHMAVGAKGKDIIRLILNDNKSALFMGIALASAGLVSLYFIFSQQLANYMSITLLGSYLATLSVISVIAFGACYVPLRQYIKRPAIESLRGSE